MGIFRKKKVAPERVPERIKSPCELFGHTWKDFPAYMIANWKSSIREGTVSIVEPYVCLCCKERKDITLFDGEYSCAKQSNFQEIVDFIYNKHKAILQPQHIVEDMINDTIYVDREKLDAWERLHGKREKEEFKLKLPT